MEANIFLNYFQKTFLKFCVAERPILLVYDGHTTHVDERIVRCAIENNITILKLPAHTSHLLQPMDLAVFKSLKTAWDSKLAYHQRHNQGTKINKRDFSLLTNEIWIDASPDLLISGFRKAGIYPYNRNVIDKSKYDPEAYKRYQRSKALPAQQNDENQAATSAQTSTAQQPEESSQTSHSTNEQLLNDPIQFNSNRPSSQISISDKGISVENQSFETLLLATLKQNPQTCKTKRKKVAPGAEVITADEYMAEKEKEREKEKNREIEKKNKKDKGRKKKKLREDISSSDEDTFSVQESDSSELQNVEEFLKEMQDRQEEEEMDEAYFARKRAIKVGHWVLVKFFTKKKMVHFVGQVTKVNNTNDCEVMFLRYNKSSKQGTSFNWPENRDINEIDLDDIVTVLPEPTLGRRADMHFSVSFSSYNLH